MLPEDIRKKLKPEFVSPLVAYLCSASCEETGGLFEVGAGAYFHLKWFRSPGLRLGAEEVSVEKIAENFGEVTDMSKATVMGSIQESTMSFLG